MPEPGAAIGPFRVIASLGSGGMAEVFLVEAGDGAPVPGGSRLALKLLRRELTENGEVVERFRREAAAGGRVEHPAVVATLGAGCAAVEGCDRQYMLMEWVEGRTLRDLLAETERLPETAVLPLAHTMASALEAIHGAGLVHRDVKPENVLLATDGRVLLSDLGLARVREEELRLTRTGQFLGSLFYASPEQVRGARDLDPRSDLYSLGVVLFECLTGQNPFAHAELRIVIRRHLEDRPPRAGFLVPEVSLRLEEILDLLLRKVADERIASAGELRRILEEGEESRWWRSRRAVRTEQAIKDAARRVRSASSILESVEPPRSRRVDVREPGAPTVPPSNRAESHALGRLVGPSERMQTVRKKMLAFAGFRGRHVLFAGETGVGKTLCARALHEMTFGIEAELRILDGRTISRTGEIRLTEDASRAGRGRVGPREDSLLVEGVEDLDEEGQAWLLALVARESETGPGRIMATSALPSTEEGLGRHLRGDLFYRLRGLALPLPPLRERPDDVIPLAEHFLRRAAESTGSRWRLAPDAEALLRGFSWPGNIRQLRDAVQAALLESSSPDFRLGADAFHAAGLLA